MNWQAVVKHLEDQAFSLRERADGAFVHDQKTKDEMYGRARIAELLAGALRAGLTTFKD